MTVFSDMLRYYRKKNGWSQSELAEKLGTSASTIGMYEQGRREPDFETEEKLADIFEVDLNMLRGRDASQKKAVPENENIERLLLYARKLTPENQKLLVELAATLLHNSRER